MASSVLDVQLTMVKVMQALQLNDASLITPLKIETDLFMNDQVLGQTKSVNFVDERTVTYNTSISSSEPTPTAFTPPINIEKSSLTYSTEFTPALPNRFQNTAPATRYKTEADMLKAVAKKKSTEPVTPTCSLEFTKVSLKNSSTCTALNINTPQQLSQPAGDGKIKIKRSVGF